MMPSEIRMRSPLIVFLIIMFGLTGCTGKSPKADFYALNAAPATGPADGALAQNLAIAVGPVTIPAELDRKQIVTRDAGNRVRVAELSRWAGPLQDSIAAVLTANLASRLGTDKIAPYNREDLFPFTHHVILNFYRFDGRPEGDVILKVTWSIKKNGVSAPLVIQHTEIREPVTAPGYTGLVATQSRTLDALSSRIAAAFAQMAP